jgi:hypothetical protein
MESDEDKEIENFLRTREAIKEVYIEKYGKNEAEAEEIATRIALKLFIKAVGRENAEKLFKKRGSKITGF